jgi:hypothetical protein
MIQGPKQKPARVSIPARGIAATSRRTQPAGRPAARRSQGTPPPPSLARRRTAAPRRRKADRRGRAPSWRAWVSAGLPEARALKARSKRNRTRTLWQLQRGPALSVCWYATTGWRKRGVPQAAYCGGPKYGTPRLPLSAKTPRGLGLRCGKCLKKKQQNSTQHSV